MRARLPWVDRFANLVSDTYYMWDRQTPDPRVVAVAIDNASVRALGHWPGDRSELAEGLERLAQAKVVALDMIFSEPTTAAGDSRLAAVLRKLNAVGGFMLNGQSASRVGAKTESDLLASAITDVRGTPHLRFVASDRLELNVPVIQRSLTFTAALDTLPDSDELFRRYPLAFITKGNLIPSLGLQALRLFFNQDIRVETGAVGTRVSLGDDQISPDDHGFTRLAYYPRQSYRIIPFIDLLRARVSPTTFRGKIVLVGVTEAGVGDVHSTPIGQVPGLLLHYTFISNVLAGVLPIGAVRLQWLLLVMAGLYPLLAGLWIRRLPSRFISYGVVSSGIYFLGALLYVEGHYWLDATYPLLSLGFSAVANDSYAFIAQERQARLLRAAFSSYVSPALLDQIIAHPHLLRLGGVIKEVTLLFSDIRNFTTLSERTDTETLAQILNDLFTPLTEAILENHGMLDKYVGDAIMAVFNAPVDVDDHPYRACRAAIAMLERLAEFNKRQAAAGKPELDIGIGINTGTALVGNLGSRMRFNYTAIGDAVNLASRIEGLNKECKTHILIGKRTWNAVNTRVSWRFIGDKIVKGKTVPEAVYELKSIDSS